MKDTQLVFLAAATFAFACLLVVATFLQLPATLLGTLGTILSFCVGAMVRHMDGSTTSPTPPLPSDTTGTTVTETKQVVDEPVPPAPVALPVVAKEPVA